MLHLRDISLRKRLLLSNFLMVCIPVLLLASLGAVIFAGLQFTSTTRQSELALLWPDKDSSMSVTYATTSLQTKLDKKENIHLDDIFEECMMLESQHIHIVIVSDGRLLYLSPNTNPTAVFHVVSKALGDASSGLLWRENNVAFTYRQDDGLGGRTNAVHIAL